MSYSELESGYQGLRRRRKEGFYVGHDDDDIENDNENMISLVSNYVIFCYFILLS